jgi:chemotaxis protein methyltransferase CheR
MNWAHFDDEDIEVIMGLARELTGTQVNQTQHSIIIQNIASRMADLQCRNLEEYLLYVDRHDEELPHLISATTIHTTSWFREPQAFERFEEFLMEFHARRSQQPLRLLSMACSTGEEVYSFGILLERFRLAHPSFEYQIEGWDIDPISLQIAQKANYGGQGLDAVPERYRLMIQEIGRWQGGHFTLPSTILERCRFRKVNLTQALPVEHTFDQIVCRNVLIYFSSQAVESLIQSISGALAPGGRFVCGVSETSAVKSEYFLSLGQSTYRLRTNEDRSPRKKNEFSPQLVSKTQQVHSGYLKTGRSPSCRPALILFGASTGGTDALHQALHSLPADCPPLMVVQHIAIPFAADFARRLAQTTGLTLSQMKDNELLEPGHLYIPLEDYHIGVRKLSSELRLKLSQSPPLHSHRPSVDHMFLSAATVQTAIFAALLTGMGRDGAEGLLALRQAGAMTCAQNEGSSVVFGMPREAIRLEAAVFIGSHHEIRHRLDHCLHLPAAKEAS